MQDILLEEVFFYPVRIGARMKIKHTLKHCRKCEKCQCTADFVAQLFCGDVALSFTFIICNDMLVVAHAKWCEINDVGKMTVN